MVTFPFLFGIMFGDIGHGATLFLLGAVLCLFCDIFRRKMPSMEPFLQLRYVLLMMGLFGFYCGLIYNDFMAIPLWLFESCYDIDEGHLPVNGTADGAPVAIHAEVAHHAHFKLHYKDDCVYPIGIDPAWYMGTNELTFLNSLKMKLAVILGILHMSLGICLKAFNATYFKNKLDFYFEFVPQIILMMVLFGYMDLLIIVKWCTDYSGHEHEAPSVITSMIEMALNGGATSPGFTPILGDAQ